MACGKTQINPGGVASFGQRSFSDNVNEMYPSHLQFKTFNFQLLLGAEFCSGRSMQNDWKIANVIHIKVRI